jgi:flagellar biogenesis protein FliO
MTDVALQMGTALVAVVGLVLLLGFLYRKKQRTPGLMKVVAYQSLGPKRGVAALKVGGEILLLGVTTTECRLLKTFAEKDFASTQEGVPADRLGKLRRIKEELGG